MRGTRGPRLVDAEPSYSFECPLVCYSPARPRGWNETEVEIAAACQCRASWLQPGCLQISNITFDSYDSFRWENWVWPFVSFSLLTCHIFQLHHTSYKCWRWRCDVWQMITRLGDPKRLGSTSYVQHFFTTVLSSFPQVYPSTPNSKSIHPANGSSCIGPGKVELDDVGLLACRILNAP